MANLGIDAATWTTLNRLLDEALDLPPADRARWLKSLAPEYAPLKERLADLLARASTGDGDTLLRTLPKIGTAPETRAEQPGDVVGLYRLVRKIGDGGMGTVWLAERTDGLIDRPVALKLPRGTWQRPELAARMARERKILAALNHPHIARLYDAGLTSEGLPFLALEFVEGTRLDDFCRAQQLTVAARLRLFLQVAQAVAHAHARLVVHRDLKPSNILVTVDGQVRLLDFGIAGLLEEGSTRPSDLTQAAGTILTPSYASPEQIEGAPIGVASDVYALGVVLCELLTGQRPYRLARDTRGALEEAIVRGEPVRPSVLAIDAATQHALRGDLDTIILKALKKHPDERYVSVQAFADDLERHLGGFPVAARPDSRAYRLTKFVRRHRVSVFAAAAVVGALVTGAAVALAQARVARAEQRRAEQVKDFIVSVFADADPFHGEGGTLTAAQLLQQARGRIQAASVDYPGLQVELLNLVGTGLVGLGDTNAAETAVADAVRAAEAQFGARHPLALEARLLSTDVHRYRGRMPEMRRELETLLPDVRAAAATHPDLLVRTLANFAHLEIDDGNAEASTAAAREALALAQRTLGPADARTIGCALVLAETFLHGGPPEPWVLTEVDAALQVVHDALRDHPNHPCLIQAREIRGRALSVVGRFHEAIAELEHAMADGTVTFGADSVVVGFYSGNVAASQRRIGDIAGALRRSEQSLAILAKHAQTDSYTHANNLTTRGVTLLAARRPAEAERDLATAQEILERVLEPLHWETLTARFNRAMAKAFLGRHDEAAALLAPMRESPDSISNRLWALHVLGVVERLAGRNEAAIAAQTESLSLIKESPRAEWDRARNLAERGLAALDLGRLDVAAEDFAAVIQKYERLRALPHPALAEVWVGLGRVHLARGDVAAALPWLEKAAEFWRGFDAENDGARNAARWLAECRTRLVP